MLLRDFASYLRQKGSDPTLHIVNRSDTLSEESGVALPAAEPKVTLARLVEGAELNSISVGQPSGTGFTHFLDGIERTHLPCYWAMTPTLYAYTAAVIRVRGDDRKMSTCSSANRERLLFPFSRIDPTEMRARGIDVADPYEDGEAVDEHPAAVIDKARKATNRMRARLETQLATEWVDKHRPDRDAWLVIDGSLSETVTPEESPNVIGIIKSHQTQYFEHDGQQKILMLKPGERSSVFAIVGRKRMGMYSWYLRLHPNAGRDVYFGLVRIEAPPIPETIAMADEISRWLLAERYPLALPDSRWDRLIYPIRDCEEYLRSLAPTRVMMEAAFSGL